ncbi:DUF2304 domain-containing protein [Patescibacteria group bacterium]|nr:DUF2304 domain-containing protein [Patescibacteria group bacterium]
MINGIAIIGIFFALFMGYYTFIKFKRKEITTNQSVFWGLVWTSIIIVVLIPGKISDFLDQFQIARALDLIVVLGIVFLLAVTFYLFVRVNKLKNKLNDLVESLAIKKAQKNENSFCA